MHQRHLPELLHRAVTVVIGDARRAGGRRPHASRPHCGKEAQQVAELVGGGRYGLTIHGDGERPGLPGAAGGVGQRGDDGAVLVLAAAGPDDQGGAHDKNGRRQQHPCVQRPSPSTACTAAIDGVIKPHRPTSLFVVGYSIAGAVAQSPATAGCHGRFLRKLHATSGCQGKK